MKNIADYYEDYDEENRLIKDYAHRVEFDTSIYTLNKYINEKTKLLDVGAGTGRYAFYFAEKGSSVFAMDIIEKHVEIMKNKLKDFAGLRIKVEEGNALDLSRFDSEEFDAVLCMGPLYHLKDEGQQIRCINECMRLLKPKGILAIAYINKKAHIELGENPYFVGLEPEYIEALINKMGLKIKEHIATDGVTPKIRSFINSFDEEHYKQWLNFHFATCGTKASIENTLHALIIAEN